MLKYIFAVLIFSNVGRADTFIDICSRGYAVSSGIVYSIHRYVDDPNGFGDQTVDCNRVSIQKMKQLKELDIAGFCNTYSCDKDNGILSDHAFDGLDNLELLDLEWAKLTKITAESFKSIPNLKRLRLEESGRYYQYPVFGPSPFRYLNKLEYLSIKYLGGNSIFDIQNQKTLFVGLNSLEELDLYKSEIEYLDERVFQSLPNLKYLHLGSNNLKSIPVGLFQNLSNLKQLDLSWNNFTEIPQNAFLGSKNLQYLWLTNMNYLKSVSRSYIGVSDSVAIDIPTSP